MRLRKNDQVVVIAGKDKGARGKVLRVLPERNRVVVEGVNRAKRHQKPTQRNPQGGIIEMELPLHMSNVMLVDPKSDKPTRVKMGKDKDGRKVRVATGSGAVLDG
jgi:large subunit ribosomal protein L24